MRAGISQTNFIISKIIQQVVYESKFIDLVKVLQNSKLVSLPKLLRQLKYRLIRTHVYSIESKDRLTRFGVTMFLYRIIGDGRNTGVLGVLTMSSESFYNCKKNS